jgi:hypothetical protein
MLHKGAASGKLKGQHIGVKESVCMTGIPSSGGSAVLKDFVPDMDATIVVREVAELPRRLDRALRRGFCTIRRAGDAHDANESAADGGQRAILDDL